MTGYIEMRIWQGTTISDAVYDAIKLSKKLYIDVRIRFNEVYLVVNKNSKVKDVVEEYEQTLAWGKPYRNIENYRTQRGDDE